MSMAAAVQCLQAGSEAARQQGVHGASRLIATSRSLLRMASNCIRCAPECNDSSEEAGTEEATNSVSRRRVHCIAAVVLAEAAMGLGTAAMAQLQSISAADAVRRMKATLELRASTLCQSMSQDVGSGADDPTDRASVCPRLPLAFVSQGVGDGDGMAEDGQEHGKGRHGTGIRGGKGR